MKKLRYATSVVLISIGALCLYLGTRYYLSHFDIGPQPGDSWISLHYDYIGIALIAIAPLVAGMYKTALGILCTLLVFGAYLWLA